MKQRTLVIISIIASLSLGTLAYAQESSPNPARRRLPVNIQERTIRGIKERTIGIETERKTEIEEKQMEKKAALEERLKNVRDENKRKIARHFNDQLHAINMRMTGHFMDVLARLRTALLNHAENILAAPPQNTDTAGLKDAIAKAKAALDEAEKAAKTQQEKVYDIVFTDDKIGGAARAVKQQLHDDLAAVRAKVVAARNAVKEAIKVARELRVIPAPPGP